MADRILAKSFMGKRDEAFASMLRSCERIIVDDVSEYVYAGTEQEYWDWSKDFPNLAPPFPIFWMEAIAPKVIRSSLNPGELRLAGDYGRGDFARLATVGVLVQGHRRPSGTSSQAFIEDIERSPLWSPGGPDNSELMRSEIEWAVLFTLFFEHVNHHFYLGPIKILFLDKMGVLIDARNPDGTIQSMWMTAKMERAEAERSALALFPFALAISLMHCKNVELVRKPQNPKLAKAYRRRHKEPLLTYHVLDIEPMKRVLRDEGDAEHSGLRHALHICRGHFKDYRQRGLFGRHKGMFWFESHLRGSAEVGTAVKDYRVRQAGGRSARERERR